MGAHPCSEAVVPQGWGQAPQVFGDSSSWSEVLCGGGRYQVRALPRLCSCDSRCTRHGVCKGPVQGRSVVSADGKATEGLAG